MVKRSISVIIPCLNEEENLPKAYENVTAALRETMEEYEIFIFNDGSRDGTAAVADAIKKKDPAAMVIHNQHNEGLGRTFAKGVEMARMNYVVLVPGDNEISYESIRRIFRLVGKADLIIPFTVNVEIRPWGRRLVSRLFTVAMNAIFLCELQYYNGPTMYRTNVVRSLNVETSGFGFQAVLLVKLLRSGHSFCEMDMYLERKPIYRSSATRIRNVLSVIGALLRLAIAVQRDPSLRKFEKLNRLNPHLS